MGRPLRVALGGVVVTAVVSALLAVTPGDGRAADVTSGNVARAAAAGKPNVVVIMADDMRVDDLKFAPSIRKLIGKHGLTFENSFSPFPLCCPARASFLTGQYAHNHKVWWHDPPFGYRVFDDSRTLATSLRASGYQTGFIGKYLNRYGIDRSRVSGKPSHSYVPKGWTDWRGALENPRNKGFHGSTYNYFDTPFNVNGRVVDKYWGRYQTDVIGDMSVDMTRNFSRTGDPFFMYVNYVAPHHGGPREKDDPAKYTPAAGRGNVVLVTPAVPKWVRGTFDHVIRRGSGIAKRGEKVERNLSDKPRRFQRGTRRFTARNLRDIREVTRQRAESIFVMDRNIARTVKALKSAGEWDNTVFVFTSDNGVLLGEHGHGMTKVWAHEPSLRVPMLVTGPGMRTAQRRYDPISTIDLTATILDIGDAAAPRRADGVSRWPSMLSGDRGWTTPVVTEAIRTASGNAKGFKDRRSAIGIRTSRYSFIRYRDGSGELYDLVKDPRQNENAYRSKRYRSVKRALNRVWTKVKDCDGAECRAALPVSLAAGPNGNRGNTQAYWSKIRRWYSW